MLTHIGSLEIRNPVILASGLRGDSPTDLKAAYDAGAGAVVTKSITLKPRDGYPEPTVVKMQDGSWLNAIGLRNVGAVEFAHRLGKPDYPVIVSLAGADPMDFVAMIKLFDHAAAFELNLSCPNVAGLGDDVGDDVDLTERVVRTAKSVATVPVFVKVAYNMKTVEAALKAGADGITAINTVPALALPNIETGEQQLSSMKCGMSGPPIKNIALGAVSKIATRHNDIPIMGCGGISTWQDAAEFLEVGAVAIQVGSAAMDNLNVLGEIAAGLANWTPTLEVPA